MIVYGIVEEGGEDEWYTADGEAADAWARERQAQGCSVILTRYDIRERLSFDLLVRCLNRERFATTIRTILELDPLPEENAP